MFPGMSSWQGRGGGEDERRHGILTASGADEGKPSQGQVTLRKHEPVRPEDIQLCREKKKQRPRKNTPEKCVGVAVHGFFCDSSCLQL